VCVCVVLDKNSLGCDDMTEKKEIVVHAVFFFSDVMNVKMW